MRLWVQTPLSLLFLSVVHPFTCPSFPSKILNYADVANCRVVLEVYQPSEPTTRSTYLRAYISRMHCTSSVYQSCSIIRRRKSSLTHFPLHTYHTRSQMYTRRAHISSCPSNFGSMSGDACGISFIRASGSKKAAAAAVTPAFRWSRAQWSVKYCENEPSLHGSWTFAAARASNRIVLWVTCYDKAF